MRRPMHHPCAPANAPAAIERPTQPRVNQRVEEEQAAPPAAVIQPIKNQRTAVAGGSQAGPVSTQPQDLGKCGTYGATHDGTLDEGRFSNHICATKHRAPAVAATKASAPAPAPAYFPANLPPATMVHVGGGERGAARPQWAKSSTRVAQSFLNSLRNSSSGDADTSNGPDGAEPKDEPASSSEDSEEEDEEEKTPSSAPGLMGDKNALGGRRSGRPRAEGPRQVGAFAVGEACRARDHLGNLNEAAVKCVGSDGRYLVHWKGWNKRSVAPGNRHYTLGFVSFRTVLLSSPCLLGFH